MQGTRLCVNLPRLDASPPDLPLLIFHSSIHWGNPKDSEMGPKSAFQRSQIRPPLPGPQAASLSRFLRRAAVTPSSPREAGVTQARLLATSYPRPPHPIPAPEESTPSPFPAPGVGVSILNTHSASVQPSPTHRSTAASGRLGGGGAERSKNRVVCRKCLRVGRGDRRRRRECES